MAQPTPLYRGIASFLAYHQGTVQRGKRLTLRANPVIGIDVFVGNRKLATVVLLEDETITTLENSLPRLYRSVPTK